MTVSDLVYPAVDLDSPGRLIGAFVSAGKAYEFGESVAAGVDGAYMALDAVRNVCSNPVRWVLVGYSQGAIVVSEVANAFREDELIYVLTIGDPGLNLPEGEGLFPEACDGRGYSSWRLYAPNCRTRSGVFGARDPYEPSWLQGKFAAVCNDNDFICGSSRWPFNNSGHTEYFSSGRIAWALDTLNERNFKDCLVKDADELVSARGLPTVRLAANEATAAQIVLRRDGDSARLSWTAPEDAKWLYLRLNGYPLGMVDATQGELEICDMDYGIENDFSFAWADDSELGEYMNLKLPPGAQGEFGVGSIAAPDAEPSTEPPPDSSVPVELEPERSQDMKSDASVDEPRSIAEMDSFGNIDSSTPAPITPQAEPKPIESTKVETNMAVADSRSQVPLIATGLAAASLVVLLFFFRVHR